MKKTVKYFYYFSAKIRKKNAGRGGFWTIVHFLFRHLFLSVWQVEGVRSPLEAIWGCWDWIWKSNWSSEARWDDRSKPNKQIQPKIRKAWNSGRGRGNKNYFSAEGLTESVKCQIEIIWKSCNRIWIFHLKIHEHVNQNQEMWFLFSLLF